MDSSNRMHVVPKKEATAQETNKKVRRRATVLLVFYILAAFGLIARLAWLQLVKGDEYGRMAYAGQTRQQQIKPKRGSIYDRNGKGLAISAEVSTVSINPLLFQKEIVDKPEVVSLLADKLSEILQIDRATIYDKLMSTESYLVIARKIEKEKGELIREYLQQIEVGSVFVDADSKRYYPKGSLASHVIGFTGTDDQGLIGIELEMDGILKGQAGKILNEVDANGNAVRFNEDLRLEPEDGYDVTLTIDETIQDMTENALAGIIKQWNVKNGASAIVIDPNTGEVLAIASLPDFNPNNPDEIPAAYDGNEEWAGFSSTENTQYLWENVFRNKAIMDTYEPGSTFKAITAAAALETGIISPETVVVDAPYEIGDWTIHCWKAGGHGTETFREAVYNSCNPVFSKVSIQLGLKQFYHYVHLFGFMENTGIEIAGEPSNDGYRSLWHTNPTETNMAVASFGQRVQVSPIQLASAYTAIANGGLLMKPTVIKQVTDANGTLIFKNEPQVIRKVISKQTSETLRDLLEGVVTEGTGKGAYITGYQMAGKTGTSETLQTEESGRYIVSFMSFAPADHPEVCLLIEVDWPQAEVSTDIGGGKIVAPVAGKLMEQILSYLKVERQYSEKDKLMMEKETYVPDILDMTVGDAKERMQSYGFHAYALNNDIADTEVIHDESVNASSASNSSNTTTNDEQIDASNKDSGTDPSLEENADINTNLPIVAESVPIKLLEDTEENRKRIVNQVFPAVGSKLPTGSTLYLYTGEKPSAFTITVPDLLNHNIQEAKNVVLLNHINIRILGTGKAISQTPSAGEVVEIGTVIEVQFQ